MTPIKVTILYLLLLLLATRVQHRFTQENNGGLTNITKVDALLPSKHELMPRAPYLLHGRSLKFTLTWN